MWRTIRIVAACLLLVSCQGADPPSGGASGASSQTCSLVNQNLIGTCALDLHDIGLLGASPTEYLLKSKADAINNTLACRHFTEFRKCAEPHIQACLQTPMRHNHHLIALEAWATLCSQNGGKEAMKVLACITNLNRTERYTTCETKMQGQFSNSIGSFVQNDNLTCNVIESHLLCLQTIVIEECGAEAFTLLTTSYLVPLGYFLKNCTLERIPAAYKTPIRKSAAPPALSVCWYSFLLTIMLVLRTKSMFS